MEHREEIGFQVNVLSHRIRQMMNSMEQEEESAVPGMQGWIIGYLYSNQDRDLFQRDIQAHFSIRRSTATGVLKAMEQDGLVTRTSVERDARLKKLELTPKAKRLHEAVIGRIIRMEQALSATLSPEEKTEFIRLCGKIRDGIDAQCGEKT